MDDYSARYADDLRAALTTAQSEAAELRKALEAIEHYTHTHCTQKYALAGIDTIREEVRAALKETQHEG